MSSAWPITGTPMPSSWPNKTVFLDRDGVINVDSPGTVLVKTGNGSSAIQTLEETGRSSDHVAADLDHAA